MSEQASSFLQENVLTCLCFDERSAPVIRQAITPELFTSAQFRAIAEQAIAYLDQFKEPVGNHLPDVLEHLLAGDSAETKRRARVYERIIRSLHSAWSAGVNSAYVLSQLESFINTQSLHLAISEAAALLQEGRADEARRAIEAAQKRIAQSFNPGTRFGKGVPADALFGAEDEVMPMGIPYLKQIRCGPAKQTLLTFVAPTGRGKTWASIHMGKMAALSRRKVLHVTLEMSERRVMGRYLQSFFSLARREGAVQVPRFTREKEGQAFVSMDMRDLQDLRLLDQESLSTIEDQIEERLGRVQLIVKQFPTGTLTVPALLSYMDMLEQTESFKPDLLVVDYADLMRLDSANLRIDTGNVYKDLRGLAVARDVAVATPSQTNRTGEDVRVVTLKHLAEDYSKAATSDIVLTYNQTPWEAERNLARLFVAKNRDEEGHAVVLLSQAYKVGQFVLDSALQTAKYTALLPKGNKGKSEDES